LEAIDVGTKGSFEKAGRLLEYELGKVLLGESVLLLPEYINLLEILRKAAVAANEKVVSKRGPKGAGGNRHLIGSSKVF
jgi:hypothetical protein